MQVVNNLDYTIKNIKIEGFWGSYTVQTDFKPDVNIFVGKNGTGKTTFIDILNAVLTVDLPLMLTQTFSVVSIELQYKKKIRKIKVTRDGDTYPFEMVKYKIGNKVFELPMASNEYGYKRFHPKHKETLMRLKSAMKELVNVSWLSVHREILTEAEIEEELWIKRVTPIDHRLNELMGQLTSYQLKLEKRVGEYSNKFQRDVLTSTLFDEKLDRFDAPKKNFHFAEEKEALMHAFEELGVPLDDTRIEKHFSEVEKSIATLNKSNENGDGLTIDDVLPLSLLKRTQYIIKLSRDAESHKRKIFEFRENFLKLLHDFGSCPNFRDSPH